MFVISICFGKYLKLIELNQNLTQNHVCVSLLHQQLTSFYTEKNNGFDVVDFYSWVEGVNLNPTSKKYATVI